MSPGRRTPPSLLEGAILGSLLKLSIPIVVAFVLSRDGVLGLEGLWWGYPVTNVLIAVVTVIWFMKGDWKQWRLVESDPLAERVTEEVLIEERSA